MESDNNNYLCYYILAHVLQISCVRAIRLTVLLPSLLDVYHQTLTGYMGYCEV